MPVVSALQILFGESAWINRRMSTRGRGAPPGHLPCRHRKHSPDRPTIAGLSGFDAAGVFDQHLREAAGLGFESARIPAARPQRQQHRLRDRKAPVGQTGSIWPSSQVLHSQNHSGAGEGCGIPDQVQTRLMPCRALTSHTSCPGRSSGCIRRCSISMDRLRASSWISEVVTPGSWARSGCGTHSVSSSHHSRLEVADSTANPCSSTSSTSSHLCSSCARVRSSPSRAMSGPFVCGCRRGSENGGIHTLSSSVRVGAGLSRNPSAGSSSPRISTLGNHSPERGMRSMSADQKSGESASVHPSSRAALLNRRRCRSNARTLPSPTNQESAIRSSPVAQPGTNSLRSGSQIQLLMLRCLPYHLVPRDH